MPSQDAKEHLAALADKLGPSLTDINVWLFLISIALFQIYVLGILSICLVYFFYVTNNSILFSAVSKIVTNCN